MSRQTAPVANKMKSTLNGKALCVYLSPPYKSISYPAAQDKPKEIWTRGLGAGRKPVWENCLKEREREREREREERGERDIKTKQKPRGGERPRSALPVLRVKRCEIEVGNSSGGEAPSGSTAGCCPELYATRWQHCLLQLSV